MKRGDIVLLIYCGQAKRAMVLLASPNGKSLMLGFEGALYNDSGDEGGAFFGSMPVLRDDAGIYRDLVDGTIVTIEPFSSATTRGQP